MVFIEYINDFLNLLPYRKKQKKKVEIRQKLNQKRKIMDKELAAKQSENIVEQLMNDSDFVSAEHILIYYPIQNEVDLRKLAELAPQKHFYLPVTHRSSIEIKEWKYGDKLEKGKFGIPEPNGKNYKGKLDLLLVPGVAFDRHGNRLGRGGGYYDKFLNKYRRTLKIGVCYDFQIVSELPVNYHDKKVNKIIVG